MGEGRLLEGLEAEELGEGGPLEGLESEELGGEGGVDSHEPRTALSLSFELDSSSNFNLILCLDSSVGAHHLCKRLVAA